MWSVAGRASGALVTAGQLLHRATSLSAPGRLGLGLRAAINSPGCTWKPGPAWKPVRARAGMCACACACVQVPHVHVWVGVRTYGSRGRDPSVPCGLHLGLGELAGRAARPLTGMGFPGAWTPSEGPARLPPTGSVWILKPQAPSVLLASPSVCVPASPRPGPGPQALGSRPPPACAPDRWARPWASSAGADTLNPFPQDGRDPRCEWPRGAASATHWYHRHPAVLQVGARPPSCGPPGGSPRPLQPAVLRVGACPRPVSPLPSESPVRARSGPVQGWVVGEVSPAD